MLALFQPQGPHQGVRNGARGFNLCRKKSPQFPVNLWQLQPCLLMLPAENAKNLEMLFRSPPTSCPNGNVIQIFPTIHLGEKTPWRNPPKPRKPILQISCFSPPCEFSLKSIPAPFLPFGGKNYGQTVKSPENLVKKIKVLSPLPLPDTHGLRRPGLPKVLEGNPGKCKILLWEVFGEVSGLYVTRGQRK